MNNQLIWKPTHEYNYVYTNFFKPNYMKKFRFNFSCQKFRSELTYTKSSSKFWADTKADTKCHDFFVSACMSCNEKPHVSTVSGWHRSPFTPATGVRGRHLEHTAFSSLLEAFFYGGHKIRTTKFFMSSCQGPFFLTWHQHFRSCQSFFKALLLRLVHHHTGKVCQDSVLWPGF